MSSNAAPPSSSLGNPRFDRWFFSSIALLSAVTVFVGFAPTFYLKPWVEHPKPPLTHLFVVHGSVFTCWILLIVVQTLLVAVKRTDFHRKLGVAGACLAAIMVPLGVYAALVAAHRGSAPPGADPIRFLGIPLFDILLFAVFVASGISARRDPAAHKRLMLLSTIAILDAAIARWPFAIMRNGPIAFFCITDLFLLALVAFDLLRLGRVHRATAWGGALLVASQPLRLALMGTPAWLAFATWAAGLVS